MLSLLTECTVLMLRMICELYNEQKITYSEFVSFTENKLQFLMDNLNGFATESEKNNALDALNSCVALLAQSDCFDILSSLRANADMVQ